MLFICHIIAFGCKNLAHITNQEKYDCGSLGKMLKVILDCILHIFVKNYINYISHFGSW